MPKGITFTDEKEAREYASQMESEGQRTAISHYGKFWRVILLGEERRKPSGEYRGSGEIFFSYKPTTQVRLHELAHKELKHEPGMVKTTKVIDNEIDAEIWARERMNKKITPRVGLPAFSLLVTDLGYEENEALALVVDRLKRKDIEVSIKDYEDLRRFEA